MMRVRLGALGLAVLCLAGCASLRSAPPVRTFRLTYRPPEPSGAAPLPATVRVMPFGIVSAYDSQAFLYRTGPYDVGIDYYNRWVGNPSTMITDLVARDLAASKTVLAVFQEPTAVPVDYELTGYIETLEERDQGSDCTAHLRVRISITHVTREQRRVVLQENLVADTPCTAGDAESFAAAMSQSVEQISERIRALLREAATP
jgi:ABC-type uncharacterized transport system auxiliary subunit